MKTCNICGKPVASDAWLLADGRTICKSHVISEPIKESPLVIPVGPIRATTVDRVSQSLAHIKSNI